MTSHDATASTRRFLVAASFAAVLFAGVLGLFAGANNTQFVSSVRILGLITLPVTPVTFAVFGMALTATVVVLLFAALLYVSRTVDDDAPEMRD